MGKNSAKKRIECLTEWLKIERGIDLENQRKVKRRTKNKKFVREYRKKNNN